MERVHLAQLNLRVELLQLHCCGIKQWVVKGYQNNVQTLSGQLLRKRLPNACVSICYLCAVYAGIVLTATELVELQRLCYSGSTPVLVCLPDLRQVDGGGHKVVICCCCLRYCTARPWKSCNIALMLDTLTDDA